MMLLNSLEIKLKINIFKLVFLNAGFFLPITTERVLEWYIHITDPFQRLFVMPDFAWKIKKNYNTYTPEDELPPHFQWLDHMRRFPRRDISVPASSLLN